MDYIPSDEAPSRAEIDATSGLVLLEFGTPWCGICQAAEPRVAALMKQHPEIRHVKVEDGPGLALGRSFGVKLWPNFVFLKDGQVVRQLARPTGDQLKEAFSALAVVTAG